MSAQMTFLQALMHLLKSYVGTGILALPKAFSYSGIIIGCIGTPFIGLLCHCCIHMLIEINDHLCHKLGLNIMDYEEKQKLFSKRIAHRKSLRRRAETTEKIRQNVFIFLFCAQIGFCCAYYLFIADNIRQFFTNLEINGMSTLSVNYYLLMILPFMVGISFVRDIKHLSIASMFANVLQLVSFAIIIYNLVTDVGSVADRQLIGDKVPEFFSTTMFTYEGITVTMTLYKSIKRREDFAKPFGVINSAIVIVMASYTVVGFLGYLKYGDSVAASITLSLPKEAAYISVQLMYSLAIAVSYPIQLYIAIHLMWPSIECKLQEYKPKKRTINLINFLFRSLLVLLTYLLAVLIPKLELILSLNGAVSCSTVAIIIPPVLHTITFWEMRSSLSSRLWLCARNGIIFTFGIIGFGIGTYFSVKDIILDLQ